MRPWRVWLVLLVASGASWAKGVHGTPQQATPKPEKRITGECPDPKVCPPDGYIDCMPGPGPVKCACIQRKWVLEHCPKVQFAD